jgi:hypothetical protein
MAAALHDKNGDGVLNSDEFAELISAVTGKQDAFLGNGRSGRDILQMYSDAIHVRSALSLSPRVRCTHSMNAAR